MRHLCVILSYIAQNSQLLPLSESSHVSVKVWPLNYAFWVKGIFLFFLIRSQLINRLYLHIFHITIYSVRLIYSKILLTCTGRINMSNHVFHFPSMFYKCRSLSIFPKIKRIAQDRIWTNSPNIFSVLLYHWATCAETKRGIEPLSYYVWNNCFTFKLYHPNLQNCMKR